MRQYTPDPRVYEMMTILSPEISEDDLPAQIETIAGYITTAGGTVDETLRESPWGRRRLAYSIRHAGRDIRDGFYTVHHFTLDPGGVRDIERDLKLNDQVMRFLITHYTPKADVPGSPTGTTAEGPAEGQAAPTSDGSAVASSEPAEVTAADETAPATEQAAGSADVAIADATEPASPETEVPSTEAAEPAEALAEVAAPAETSDTEAASSEPESAASESVPVSEVAADEPASEAPVSEPATEEDPVSEPVAEEPPAEPTAPAKDNEEA